MTLTMLMTMTDYKKKRTSFHYAPIAPSGFDHQTECRSKFFKSASRWQKAVKKVLEEESGKQLCKPADFLNEEVKLSDQSQRQMQSSAHVQPRVEWIECEEPQVSREIASRRT